ncbi:hypothetical protein Zmor_027251 [Zophobas morio]|uniref:Alpha/beta hydrolase fold-3 domain-containing protein n=1 Tax=Zophobas morio TaxID=2755281 RepID=A0AA38HQ37_9CUCU|nr:hypothetical protein Zmor_027251 [Zophobas morio]
MQTSLEPLEKLYLPSRWSQRYPPDTIVEKHVEFAQTESDKTRQTIPSMLNLSYGPLEKEKIDIFGTDLDNDAPIFVFVHGGYWQEESLKRDTYHFLATPLYKNGIKSIFVGYELCPKVSLPEIVKEIEVATKKCVEYAKENKSKGVHLVGYSAGSHLVAALYTNIAKNLSNEERNFIKTVILIAGVYNLELIPETSINGVLNLSKTDAVALSPLKQSLVGEISSTMCVVSAENDSPEFRKQSKEFHDKLEHAGVDSSAIVVPKVDHFDIVELLYSENFQLTKSILDLIKNK